MVKATYTDPFHTYYRNKAKEYYKKNPLKKKVYHLRKKWNIPKENLEEFPTTEEQLKYIEKEIFKIKYAEFLKE